MFNKAAVYLFKREPGNGQLKDIFNCMVIMAYIQAIPIE